MGNPVNGNWLHSSSPHGGVVGPGEVSDGIVGSSPAYFEAIGFEELPKCLAKPVFSGVKIKDGALALAQGGRLVRPLIRG